MLHIKVESSSLSVADGRRNGGSGCRSPEGTVERGQWPIVLGTGKTRPTMRARPEARRWEDAPLPNQADRANDRDAPLRNEPTGADDSGRARAERSQR